MSSKDYKFEILPTLKAKFLNMSNNTILFMSGFSSGYMSYRYLKSKELFSEYHGHFNSPRNELNRRLTWFHWQESVARFGLGVLVIGGVTLFFQGMLKQYLGSDLNYAANSDSHTKSQPDEELLKDSEYNNFLKLNDYEMNKDQVYNLEDTIRRDKIVKEYSKKITKNNN